MVVLTALMLTMAFTTGDAFAKGSSGFGGGSRSSSSSGSRSSSSGGRTTRSPSRSSTSSKTSSSGRRTSAPSRPKTDSSKIKGRSTRPPGGTGTKVVRSTVRNTTQPSAGAITISKGTTAGGRNYHVPGTSTTYHYRVTTYHSYYTTYHGGYLGYYPPLGSSMYWTLWNDPFYYPNYITVGSPWYGHPTPVGYNISNNELIAVHHKPFPWGTFFLCLLIIALVAAAYWYFVHRSQDRRDNTPYDL